MYAVCICYITTNKYMYETIINRLEMMAFVWDDNILSLKIEIIGKKEL